ncbi:MAG: hypothetical protein JWN66_3166 [Sphingomonas bacterium]|uniref:hypothetical protein n=1 Tax=Sphingomonas bacterium TaxID=1895847 RepID=UPI0026078BAC|nr:hypothetical protein [Sphingomonas bacterium]MDB5706050.1 hypothetical protein [Sphingomonas bacterium]
MEVTTRIDRSFADEHVIGCDPPLRPDVPNVWRRRMHPFAGRAVSDKALTAEQDVRSGLQRLYGLSLSPGSVAGLEVTAEADAIGAKPDAARLQVAPGLGLAISGEDVSIGGARRVLLADMPVIMRVDHADAIEEDKNPDILTVSAPTGGDRLRPILPRRVGRTLGELADNAHSVFLPHVAVLVAQPITATILGRPTDGCPPDARDDAYVDLQRIDGARLALFLWPSEVTATDGGPDYALPGNDKARRNRLAYAAFDNEKLFAPGDGHPWDAWGVPLAVLGFDPDWSLGFVDRFAVVRTGGTPGNRTPLVPMTGDARLWQARIDQFVHQLSEQSSFDEALLRDSFPRMPPVGLLPRDLFDPILRRQTFFPGSFGISAVPVPRSNLDLAIREAAALASYNRSAPDRVELLVPVPDTVYEPDLLEIEVEDPRFATTVAAFMADRAHWLASREIGRRRLDRLNEAISGQPGRWPVDDLPMTEDCPDPGTEPPVEATRTRRFNENSAARIHYMTGAAASLPIAKTDIVWMWVRIHSAANLTGLSLRLGTGTQPIISVPFAAGVFWGTQDQLPIAAEGLNGRRVGDVPEAGRWVRLEVPASQVWTSNGLSLADFAINAVEFGQHGGQVEWGPFGRTDASGQISTFLADDAPAGSALFVSGQPAQGWPWAVVPGRETVSVPDFGTVEADGVRHVAALDPFRAQWPQPFLAKDLRQVEETGLDIFLAAIKGRLDATNDAIDLGFVRARSDIYRVRQFMLGADSASRLVTSPALADLSARDEGARATATGISAFLDRLAVGDKAPAPTPSSTSPTPSPSPAPTPGGIFMPTMFVPSFMTLNVTPTPTPAPTHTAAMLTSFSVQNFAGTASVESRERLLSSSSAAAIAAPTASLNTPLSILPFAAAFNTTPFTASSSLGIARLGLATNRYEPADIRAQRPVAGLVERTMSVAERLKPSPAVQALDYAIASKAAVIATLAGLARTDGRRPIGIALGDLPLPGFKLKAPGADSSIVPSLDDLLADQIKPDAQRTFIDSDKIPADAQSKHESDYFTAAVSAIDNSVAIMRLVEGRIALFEDLRDSIVELRTAILGQANAVAAWLRNIDVEVEEARHDVAVAAQLRAEEAARVATTNARRQAVLEAHVTVVAWRRVREADHRDASPMLEIASGLAPDPVIACRQEHEDVPDEIHDYVELLRDAPVKWFPKISAEVARIDRLEAARAAIEAMRYRAMLPILARQFVPTTKLLYGVQQAFVSQQRVVADRRTMVTQIDYTRVATLSLAQTHVQIRETASLGDLIDGRHRQPTLTRMANEEIAAIGQVAACLHASFGDVAPVIRLGWAEILSEFDRPAPLDSLSGLPGWPEVPIADRRTLQGFVDWLFSRIDRTQLQAVNAVNELVRIALLMAAHAPVDQIIPAHLVAPAPAVLGTRFQLSLDVLRVRKGMVTLIRDRNDRIVSRAVIDDVVDGHAMAVMTHNLAGIVSLTADLRYHLISGAG